MCSLTLSMFSKGIGNFIQPPYLYVYIVVVLFGYYDSFLCSCNDKRIKTLLSVWLQVLALEYSLI